MDLWLKTRKKTPNLTNYIHPRSGNPRLFRALCAGIGLFGGAAMGILLSAGALLQWVVVILMAILGGVSAYLIQRWAYEIFFLGKRHTAIAAILCVCWVLLDILAGFSGISILVVLTQILAGLLAAFGGRRSEEGRLAMSYTLGLRRYLAALPNLDLGTTLEEQPDFFHCLAPYALALGVDRHFARRFGKHHMLSCPYLTTGKELQLSAMQWSSLMRRTVKAMEAGIHQRFLDSVSNFIRSFMK